MNLMRVEVSVLMMMLFCALYVGSLKVLVIGGTGRVGRAVVSRLVRQGVQTSVLARTTVSIDDYPALTGATMHYGDVNCMADVLEACQGCDAVIAVQGPRPWRFSRPMDLFRHPRHDPRHPYNVYFTATKRILAAMELQGVPRLVRLGGSLVQRSAFHPIVVLFNLMLSGAVKWHERSEQAVRRSGVRYSLIRAPEIIDQRPVPNASYVQLTSCEDPSASFSRSTATVTVDDVADLCAACALGALPGSSVFIARHPAASAAGPGGAEDVAAALATCSISADSRPLPVRWHSSAMAVYCGAAAMLLGVLVKSIGRVVKQVLIS